MPRNPTNEKPTAPGAGPGRRPPQTASHQAQAPSALVAFALLLAGAAASMSLAGRAEQGSLGVFLLCAGAAMVACPPRLQVRPEVAGMAVLLLLASGSALLPARLFHVPLWRRTFGSVPDLPLPATVSAAPEQTVFWLAILAVTILTGLFTLTQPVRSRGLSALGLAGAAVCGVYAALSILAKLPPWLYPFSTPETFGFFPNRNHTATLLITGSIVSVGILGVAFRQRQRLAANVAVATLTLCVAGLLFFSVSRGGVVFLLAGLIGWVAGLGGHRDRVLLVAVTVALLVGGGLFLLLGMGSRDRVLASLGVNRSASVTDPASSAEPAGGPQGSGNITTDDRLRIFRDTSDLIRDVPFTGTGLGTFPLVFAPYRQTSANGNVVVHPESDWLMVAAETGLPGLVCLAGLIALIVVGWRPSREHPFWPLRWGILMAAAAAALYGFADVPIHRAALGWWVLVLAGLALQPGRSDDKGHPDRRPGRMARAVFVLGGIFAALLGGWLVRAEWFGGDALAPFAGRVAEHEVARTFEQGDLEGAIARSRQSVQQSPLFSPLYYQLGVLLVRVMDTDNEIDHAFRIERLLNPWTPHVARAQAEVWMPLDPPRSAALFNEALERDDRLEQNAGRGRPLMEYWKAIVWDTGRFPTVQDRLWETGVGRGPGFVLTWLENADLQNVKERLPQVAADSRFLAQLDANQRRRLATVWRTKGDPRAMPTVLGSGDNRSK